jgi:hypothetical protein
MALQREPLLLEVVCALRPACRLACGLHGRQEEAYEHADDRNDDEQFHEREAAS